MNYNSNAVEINSLKKGYDANYFQDKSNYTKRTETSGGKKKFYYTNTFQTENGKRTLKFLPKTGSSLGADVDFNRIGFSNVYGSSINLYSKKITDMVGENKEQYNIYESTGLNYAINSAHDIRSQDVLNMYSIWFPYFVKNEFLNFKGVERGEFNKYGVKKDFLYDVNGRKGYDYSLSDGLDYYHNTVKPDLYKRYVGTDQHGNNLYRINNNFDATSEELENYFYLQGKQDIRLMYTFTGERNHSSIDGISLAQTQAEAQEKLFQIERSILSKKYFAYDVYGNYEVSGNNEDEAVRKLQQKIDLQARYVHKDEIASWNDQVVSFENVISDGVYMTYRTKVNGEWMYFLNYHDAYNALTGNTSSQKVVHTKIVNVYLYTQYKGDEKINHTYSSDEELEALANKILGYVN
ncbi:hypothetical protein [Spiroplasma alleghenense]|uniref:Uncharacterized protein n=1 Tax=Spiroplasma alleghenense TaxID=216931 RepID=A0A345Z2V4_9MOLU|nr:hypothetical protein [Spiroplasma alleghenense]AXK50933.1 hypothetical protein SALLE_v1c02570 [Spiroplasma alleghenense]